MHSYHTIKYSTFIESRLIFLHPQMLISNSPLNKKRNSIKPIHLQTKPPKISKNPLIVRVTQSELQTYFSAAQEVSNSSRLRTPSSLLPPPFPSFLNCCKHVVRKVTGFTELELAQDPLAFAFADLVVPLVSLLWGPLFLFSVAVFLYIYVPGGTTAAMRRWNCCRFFVDALVACGLKFETTFRDVR